MIIRRVADREYLTPPTSSNSYPSIKKTLSAIKMRKYGSTLRPENNLRANNTTMEATPLLKKLKTENLSLIKLASMATKLCRFRLKNARTSSQQRLRVRQVFCQQRRATLEIAIRCRHEVIKVFTRKLWMTKMTMNQASKRKSS